MHVDKQSTSPSFGSKLLYRKRFLRIDLKEAGNDGVISLIKALNLIGFQYEEDYISQVCCIGGAEYDPIVRRLLDEGEGIHWGRDDVGSLFPIN